jgi:hypothetical protein
MNFIYIKKNPDWSFLTYLIIFILYLKPFHSCHLTPSQIYSSQRPDLSLLVTRWLDASSATPFCMGRVPSPFRVPDLQDWPSFLSSGPALISVSSSLKSHHPLTCLYQAPFLQSWHPPIPFSILFSPWRSPLKFTYWARVWLSTGRKVGPPLVLLTGRHLGSQLCLTCLCND